ncbi:hypothetical protein HALTITAN_2389 [Vreelandella titanicae BH1]|uniref:Uncharacterized protein n=1 Tax=Vreelandella titanicae BH1 TaxID=1204738 RepID=L9U9F2_9GAMM|nr:hypothetical protein HALTITAN_2389 [Halomonas titanicae BH1]
MWLLLSSKLCCSWRNRSRCSSLSFTGVSTTTLHSRSPGIPPRTGFTPLPRRRNSLPVWVSGGIFSFTRPSSVGTSSSPPSAASTKLIGTSHCRCLPSRWKMWCGLIATCTYRSPGGPPFTPLSPSPFKRIRSPVSTPGGILTDSVRVSRTRPSPLHLWHGTLMCWPEP